MNTKNDLEKIYRELRQATFRALVRRRSYMDLLEVELPDDVDLSDPSLNVLREIWFAKFVGHPQIDNLIVDTLHYHFSHTANQTQTEDIALLDRVCNRCLQLLQNIWSKENNWDAEKEVHVAEAFRKFWNQLLLVRKSESVPELWKSSGVRKFLVQILEQESERQKAVVNQECATEFVPVNSAHRKTLDNYRGKIREHYSKGFIYMLGEYNFNGFYIPPTMIPNLAVESTLRADSVHTSRDLWKNILEETSITYVIGVPGSGKSLFLQNVINNYAKMNFYRSKDYLVIYCDMKTYYTNGGSNRKSVLDFLQESIINTLGMDQNEVSTDFIRYYISMGRCLVLMDALDEIPKEKRDHLHKMVVTFFKTSHSGNKVIITSRARGFIPQDKIDIYHICELTNQDIRDYIDRMIRLGKFKKEDKEMFLQQAQILIDKHFLNSFFTLSLLVSIYKVEKELPENKVNLYKKCFEYIAKKREEEKARLSYDWENIRPIMKDSTFISLADLAAPNNADIGRDRIEQLLMDLYKNKYMDEAKAEYAIQNFLDFCSNRTELFVPAQAEEKFHFFHRSFFEYFYSRLIIQQTSVAEMYRLMAQFDVDSEVFELTVAMIKEENERRYQQLIDYIFERIEREFQSAPPTFTAFSILTLSIQVIDDIGYFKKYFQVIVDHPTLMDDQGVKGLNQKLIAFGLRKIIDNSFEYAEQFCQAFCDRYVAFVIEQFAGITSFVHHIEILSKDMLQESMIQAGSIPPLRTNVRSGSLPFYVSGYPVEGAHRLKSKVFGWNEKNVADFLSRWSKKKRRRLRKGFENFFKYDSSVQDQLWEFFLQGLYR